MNEVKPALEKVTTSRWRWWIYLLIAVAVLFVGIKIGAWTMRSNDVSASSVPAVEIAATDEATKTIQERINEAQKVRAKLPEVIKRAKSDIRRDVGEFDDNGVACRWNGLLGRYREDRAAAEGVSAPE